MNENKLQKMVKKQIKDRGITDTRVIHAMETIDRELFIPSDYKPQAYEDGPQTIGRGQTISQPYIVALMTASLALEQTDTVLEIGTGSGYQTAILAALSSHVYSLERIAELSRRADKTLKTFGYNNISLRVSDGFDGLPEHAPYNAIILTCAPLEIPYKLTEQLAQGGRMVIPFGQSGNQKLILLTKNNDKLEESMIAYVRFVPMLEGLE